MSLSFYLLMKRVIELTLELTLVIILTYVMLPTTFKILSTIHFSKVTRYADEIIGDHQCESPCNRSTIVQIFSVRQILERKS
jgi:hypothetical protein